MKLDIRDDRLTEKAYRLFIEENPGLPAEAKAVYAGNPFDLTQQNQTADDIEKAVTSITNIFNYHARVLGRFIWWLYNDEQTRNFTWIGSLENAPSAINAALTGRWEWFNG